MITSENYREVYNELVEDTDDFTSESGVIKCTTKKASDIIREILANYYNVIDYGISDIEDVENNVYMIIYNDRNDEEELSFEEEEFDEPEEVEETPDDIEFEDEEVTESLSLVENYLTEDINECKSFVSKALSEHPELRQFIKEGAWEELKTEVYKLYQTDYYEDIKNESAWGKFLEVFDKSGINYSIEEIPEYCFVWSDITSFRIPEGTKRIRMCAFSHCRNLTSITIPDSVEDIDNSAFWSCVSLTEIKLPASLKIIGIDTFRNCKNWQGDVVVPDSCHAVMDGAFMKCASLKSVTIPKSVTNIGPNCFKDCNLEKLVLPDNKYKYNPWAKKIGISGMLKRKIFIAEDLNKPLVEKIVKKGSQWQVQSEKGRNMGTYNTKKEAEERLRQVEYFKHKNESVDDNFNLHHSLTEDIPTFWEWLDSQGLDADVIEENPDLEEWARQQYDITFNLKHAEDYDLLDIDVPDDYDDFDFYRHEEEELPGYHYVCYFDDDDKDEDDSGDADTLEKAMEVCDNLRASKGYDCSEIFGPKGDTVATFWEGKWNTDYGESFNEENEKHLYICDDCGYEVELTDDEYDGICPNCHEHHGFYRVDESLNESEEEEDNYWDGVITDFEQGLKKLPKKKSSADGGLEFTSNKNPAGTPIGSTVCEDLDEEPSLECLNCGADTEWLGTQGDLEEFKCPECGEYYYLTKDGRVVGEEAFQESLNEKLVNGAFDNKTFSKVLRSTELISDLDDEEFSDKLAEIFTDELTRMKSPELQNWEDGYYDDYDEVYALLDGEGRKTVTDFISDNIKIKGKSFTKKDIINTIYDAASDSKRIGKAFGSATLEYKINDNNIYVLVIADKDDGTIKVYIGNNTTREYNPSEYTFDSVDKAINQAQALADSANKAAGMLGESLTEAVAVNQWFIVKTPNGRMKDGKTTKWYISVQRNGAGVEYDNTNIPTEVTTWGAHNQRIVRVDKSNIMGIFGSKDKAIQVAKSIIEANDNFFSDLDESLTEALIRRDMDTIKRKELENVPIGSVLRIKFNDRPTNTWIDAYLKVSGDEWAVIDDDGEVDSSYMEQDSQNLYWSLMDIDEMTEFEIDTAPKRKRDLNLTDAVIDFYYNNIEKKYNRFCNIYEKAFEKIPELDFTGLIQNYPCLASNGDSNTNVCIIAGDDENSLFELYIKLSDGKSLITKSSADFFFDENGISNETYIQGDKADLSVAFNNKKDEISNLIDPLFDEAYDKLSKAIKKAGFKLGESLTEEAHETLNQAIWDENKELKPEVKSKLELIVDKFKERLKEDGVDIDIDDVIIVGSNANYNYTDKSDIDLHLVADLSLYEGKEDLAQVVYNAYRRLFNNKFDPMIYGHEVELYIEPKE